MPALPTLPVPDPAPMALRLTPPFALPVTFPGFEYIATIADDVIYVPEVEEFLQPIVTSVPLQLLAYHIALHRGCNVDRPRNLAKSVTVE